MQKYRKKPIVVEAIQYKEGMKIEGVYDRAHLCEDYVRKTSLDGRYYIQTLEGPMTVRDGDYIIRGVNGELYPCKPDIFQKTYEKVDD